MAHPKRKQPPSTHIMVRLPIEMKRWLEERAAVDFTSQNAEVVRSIRERIARETERANP